MPNPRNAIAFESIASPSDYVTYNIDGVTIVFDGTKPNGAATTMIDKAVTFTADDTVGLTVDASRVVGKLIRVSGDGKCTVQVGGFMDFPAGASASVSLGKQIVGALGAAAAKGCIREVNTGAAAELGVSRGSIQNNDDLTKVWVRL